MDLREKKVGIWGFGVVGKAAAKYCQHLCQRLEILDKRELTEHELSLASSYNAHCCIGRNEHEIGDFLERNDTIIMSPGIDTRPFEHYAHKFVCELDLLIKSYKKPIIAITGSVGKTTITHILGHILQAKDPQWWVGGNIGNCMLELLDIQDQTCGAILEVSSFQLEHYRSCAPQLGIITNVYPNHIDRHGSFTDYAKTKCHLFDHMSSSGNALVPFELINIADIQLPYADNIHFFSATQSIDHMLNILPNTNCHVFYIHNNCLMDYYQNSHTILINTNDLPDITFTYNWLIMCAVLTLLDMPLADLHQHVAQLPMPSHRLEKFATINGIDFYNDSKGTTPAATLTAVDKLKQRPIILLLGGLSKGVDRTPLIKQLAHHVQAIIVFGKEHHELAHACQQVSVAYAETITLDEALDQAMTMAKPGAQIVLSPAGSSFDQFRDYQERGNYFKQIVKKLQDLSSMHV